MKQFYKQLFVPVIIVMCYGAKSQTPITEVSITSIASSDATVYTAKGANGSSYKNKTFNYTFGNATRPDSNIKQLSSFTISGDTYSYIQNANSYVKIRRVNNAVISGTRDLIWVEKAADASDTHVSVVNPYNDNMESVFDGNSLNWGTDNLFANQGDGNGNNNNIERLDVIFPGGIISQANNKVGFALFERGADNAHDPIVIAAITAVDVDGNPTAYSNLLRVATADWGNLPSSASDYYVLRRDPAIETNLRMSTSGKQNIGGVFISLRNLGIGDGIKIYGYSIMAYDLPNGATCTDLVDYTNSNFFPTNTSSATKQGGTDLIAMTGLLSMPDVVILPPNAYNIEMPVLLNTSSLTAMLPLHAEAASGTIASYTIETIPTAAQGQVFLCTESGCTPVTAGQVLSVDEIGKLSFQPIPTYTGDVVFYYHATDTYNQISNTASYTMPLIGQNFGPLPVSLVNFSGNINNRLVQLNWQVTQERNSSYYEVLRSIDGNNFEPVATVTAKKNTNGTSVYSVTDDLYFLQQTKAYYRLKMVDTDGKIKYSAVIQVRLNAETKTITVKAWPNPFMNQLNTEYYSENNSAVKINFVDMNGRSVAATTVQVKKGQNSFAITQVQKLQRGTYIMQLVADDKIKIIKVVKQ